MEVCQDEDEGCLNPSEAMTELLKLTTYFFGEVGEWSNWSDCSKSCGGGSRIRSRECKSNFDWQVCKEDLMEEEPCGNNPCSTDLGNQILS